MKLNLQVSEQDYIHACFSIMKPTRVTKILLNIVQTGKIILLIFVIYFLAESLYELTREHGDFIEIFVLTILGIYLAWSSFFRLPQTFRRRYRESNYRVISECKIDDTLISYHNSSGDIKIPWESFSKWQESQYSFILHTVDNKLCFSRWKQKKDVLFTGSGFDIFPKHCFSSEQDVDDFRKLLIEKIS